MAPPRPLPQHASTEPAYQSPTRHHQRGMSYSRTIKETRNARSQYSNREEDGTSQLKINQYTILQEIGRGSFGAVHKAVDQFGTEYAVKEFSKSRLRKRAKSNLLRRARTAPTAQGDSLLRSEPRGVQIDNSFDLIKEEIAIMKKLNHPNLVSLIEVLDDPEEDSLYMVLEMCKKGVVMKVEVDEGADPYDEEACRCWFRDLILAIEYLHAQGVVHRDLKPDNCLLTEDDTLKVVDFGVSEMFQKESDKVQKSSGSPAFMAPELCVLKRGDISGRAADIWGMGVTLYCLRFGRVPFEKSAVLELYKAIVEDEVNLEKGLGDDFEDLMKQLLEKNPIKRIKMDKLREHPWVTRSGADPLLSKEENCAELIELPTEAEMNTAITGNVNRLVAVMKAVSRFKALLRHRARNRLNSILGNNTTIHQSPPAMSILNPASSRHSLTTRISSSRLWQRKDNPLDSQESSVRNQNLWVSNKAKSNPRPESNAQEERSQSQPPALNSTDEASREKSPEADDETEPTTATPRPLWSEGKGHAHDPLEDHRYLDVGPDPSDDPEEGIHHDPITVSESPGAAEFDVYAKAYGAEVERIRKVHGEAASIFSTRRVDKDSEQGRPKRSLASLLGKAMHQHQTE